MRGGSTTGAAVAASGQAARPTDGGRLRRGDLAVLWLASLALYLSGLWIEPLRDWEEGTYAQIAHEMAATGWAGFLHPTLWGEPYLNKPPLLFGLMAAAFRAFGESAFSARLPGAVVTSLAAPLLALLVSDLTSRRDRALWCAVVLLTLLPVLRHGRLAMLDGAATACFLVTLLGLVRAGRGAIWPLAAGLGLLGTLMTKGLLALPLLAIAAAFVISQRPRPRPLSWALVAAGTLPATGWFAAQWATYGSGYLENGLLRQGLDRVSGAIEGHRGTPAYYFLEIGIHAWPWLVFLPAGLALAWRERAEPWARLALIWLFGYLGLITLMPTKLPWYVYPAYPALAMILGSVCAEAAAGSGRRHPGLVGPGVLALLPIGVVTLAGAVFFTVGPDPVPALTAALLTVATASFACVALWRRGRPAALPVLAGGVAVALVLFTLSGRSVWELNEETRAQPLAALIRANLPEGATVLTTLGHNRPSLNYYAGRRVVPNAGSAPGAYWLTTPDRLPGLGNPPVLGRAAGWVLAGPTGG